MYIVLVILFPSQVFHCKFPQKDPVGGSDNNTEYLLRGQFYILGTC